MAENESNLEIQEQTNVNTDDMRNLVAEGVVEHVQDQTEQAGPVA